MLTVFVCINKRCALSMHDVAGSSYYACSVFRRPSSGRHSVEN